MNPEPRYNYHGGEFMQIKVPEDTQQLSLAAGFANVDQFVNSLLRKERERLAIQAGIDAMDAGQVVDFADFAHSLQFKRCPVARGCQRNIAASRCLHAALLGSNGF